MYKCANAEISAAVVEFLVQSKTWRACVICTMQAEQEQEEHNGETDMSTASTSTSASECEGNHNQKAKKTVGQVKNECRQTEEMNKNTHIPYKHCAYMVVQWKD